MADPTCLINGSPTPADVSASATVNGALANPGSGVKVWTLIVTSCDDQNTVAAIQATLVVNQSAKTFQFTAPSLLGSCVIFQSSVQDPSGTITSTTFKVNVKTSNALRVFAPNEKGEQDPVNGWSGLVNQAIRLAGSGGGGSSGGQTTGTITAGVNNNLALNFSTGITRLTFSGSPGAATITGLAPPTSIPSGSTARQTIYLPVGQVITFTHRDSRSNAGSRINTIRGTPVTATSRQGSTATVEYDSAVGEWVLVSSGYFEQPWYSARDAGVDESVADNAPLLMAMIATCAADSFRRPCRIERNVGNSQAHYENAQPLLIQYTGNAVPIQGETTLTSIRCDQFLGPMIYACPPGFPSINTVTNGAWSGIAFSGTFGTGLAGQDSYIPLSFVETMNLNQAHWTAEFMWQPTAFTHAGTLACSSGRRRIGESATTAFRVDMGTNGKMQVTFTTAGSGQQVFSTNTVMAVNTMYWIEFAYDGSFFRVFVNGVLDSKVAATGALQQGYEDVYIGTGTSLWPLGTPIFSPPIGNLYFVRFSFDGPGGSGGARHTTDASYTPPSAPITTTDANTQLLIKFAAADILAGPMLKGYTQWAPVGCNANCPVFIPFLNFNANQMAGPQIKNLSLVSALGGIGIWLNGCPSSVIDTVNINATCGVILYNNCYQTLMRGWSGFVIGGALGGIGPSTPTSFGLMVGPVDGLVEVDALATQGGGWHGYHIIVVESGARFTNGYWVSKAAQPGIVFARSAATASGIYLDFCFPGDEGGQILEHTCLFSGLSTRASPSSSSLDVTTHSGSFQSTTAANATICEIDGGGYYDFGHTFWGGVPSNGFSCIKLFGGNLPNGTIKVRSDEQELQAGEISWIPETGQSGQVAIEIVGRDIRWNTYAITGNFTPDMKTLPKSLRHEFTGALLADATITLPTPSAALKGWQFAFWNHTTGSHNLTFIGATGTGVGPIAASSTAAWTRVVCDGTNWVSG